ncbi:MAG TPA: hypothetical protein VNA04_01745 [Thermoanaerobaculia bacterium]|nr:hypothetical protein [Thermoanaerobaculia bacterium]
MSSRFFIIFYVAVVLIVVSCRREAAAPQEGGPGPTGTATTLTGPPQDLAGAQINTSLAPDAGMFVSDSRIGPSLGEDGLVAEEKTEFAANEDIHLSLWLKRSPPGLQTSAKLEDAAGKELAVERKAMSGESTVTFKLGGRKLRPGTYKVTGYWGGNVAAEYDITVVAPSSASRPAKKGK